MTIPLDATNIVGRAALELRREPHIIAACHVHAALFPVFAGGAVRLICSSCNAMVASVRLDEVTTMAIASQAREDMEKLFGGKVFLEVWVKVKRGWMDDPAALKRLGYD